jgi:hypothetical protein
MAALAITTNLIYNKKIFTVEESFNNQSLYLTGYDFWSQPIYLVPHH